MHAAKSQLNFVALSNKQMFLCSFRFTSEVVATIRTKILHSTHNYVYFFPFPFLAFVEPDVFADNAPSAGALRVDRTIKSDTI